MSYTRKIAHNTIIQIIGKGISTIIGVVVIGMLTRYLGTTGFGQYTTIMAFLQFFGVLVDLGLYIILIKKISEPGVDQDEMVSNIFTLRLVSAVVFLGLAPIIVLFLPYAPIVKVGVLVTSLSFLGVTLNQALTGVFQKHLRMDKVVIAEVVGRVVLIGATYVAIAADTGLLWVMGSVVAGSVMNFSVTFFFSRQFVKIRLRFNMAVWNNVIKDAWPIALSIAFNLVYFKADTIILSLYHSESTVGIYGAAYKVLEVLTTLPAMFAGLILPLLMMAWAAGDQERFRRVLQKAFDAMVMIAIPLAIGTVFLAHQIMDLIAPEFYDSATVLQILIFATATIFVGNLFGNTVVAINKQRTMMWVYLGVSIVSLIGYLYFIPRYSYYGAATMTVVSELMVTVAAGLIVCLTVKVWPSLKVFAKSLFASSVMAVVLWLLSGYTIAIVLVVGIVVYLGIMLLTRGITKELVREVLKKE